MAIGTHGFILCHVSCVRACVNSLKGIGLPKKGTDLLSQLAMNVRLLCTETLFQRAAKGEVEPSGLIYMCPEYCNRCPECGG